MKHSSSIHPEHVGQDFDEFLVEEGIAAEVEAHAIKRLAAALLGDLPRREPVTMFDSPGNRKDATEPT